MSDSFVVLCKKWKYCDTANLKKNKIQCGIRRAETEEQAMPKWNTPINEFANNNENNTKTMIFLPMPRENWTERYNKNNNIGKNKWRIVIHSSEIKRKFIRWNEPDEGKSKSKKLQQQADVQFCSFQLHCKFVISSFVDFFVCVEVLWSKRTRKTLPNNFANKVLNAIELKVCSFENIALEKKPVKNLFRF